MSSLRDVYFTVDVVTRARLIFCGLVGISRLLNTLLNQ